MANVHGLSDSLNRDPSSRNQGMLPFSIGAPQNPRGENIPFLSNNNREIGDPRKETVFDMCTTTCCPNLTIFSFTSMITIAQIVIFIISLLWRGLMIPNSEFLTPNHQTLSEFGNRDPVLIRYSYQIWRLLTPVLLHANFLHLFFNCVSQLIIGSQIEKVLGFQKMAFFYFLCAIGGNLFGVLMSRSLAVGGSTAIAGLLGCFIGFIIVNWNRLDPNTRCFMVCMVSFIVIINVLFGSGDGGTSQVDHSGHLGGLLTGTFLGMAVVKPIGGVHEDFEHKVRGLGIILSAVYFAGSAVLFFTVKSP